MYPSLSENMICYYYKKLASVAPEPFRRCPQAAPPASRAPPGRTWLHRRACTRARVQVRTRIQSCREGGVTARPSSEPVATDSCLVPRATRGCPVYVTVCLLARGL